MGTLIDRVHRELTDADIRKIAETYHRWKSNDEQLGSEAIKRKIDLNTMLPYMDMPGFCKSATTAEIAAHGHVLTPGRFVGAAEVEDDGEPFEQKMKRLTATLEEQFAESAKLENAIRANLKGLGYGL
jgi:type I restriction enzyme M protein